MITQVGLVYSILASPVHQRLIEDARAHPTVCMRLLSNGYRKANNTHHKLSHHAGDGASRDDNEGGAIMTLASIHWRGR